VHCRFDDECVVQVVKQQQQALAVTQLEQVLEGPAHTVGMQQHLPGVVHRMHTASLPAPAHLASSGQHPAATPSLILQQHLAVGTAPPCAGMQSLAGRSAMVGGGAANGTASGGLASLFQSSSRGRAVTGIGGFGASFRSTRNHHGDGGGSSAASQHAGTSSAVGSGQQPLHIIRDILQRPPTRSVH
jgi:hypothetical protein